MNTMEAIRESREHNRYQIAYRVHRLIGILETESQTVPQLAVKLSVSQKTVRRMIYGLESMGVPLTEIAKGRWRIIK